MSAPTGAATAQHSITSGTSGTTTTLASGAISERRSKLTSTIGNVVSRIVGRPAHADHDFQSHRATDAALNRAGANDAEVVRPEIGALAQHDLRKRFHPARHGFHRRIGQRLHFALAPREQRCAGRWRRGPQPAHRGGGVQPVADRDLHQRIMPQPVEVDGVLVAASDRRRTREDQQ